jgi:hypothetical protein
MRDDEGKSILTMHVTFIQILGSDCNDLLGGQEVLVFGPQQPGGTQPQDSDDFQERDLVSLALCL